MYKQFDNMFYSDQTSFVDCENQIALIIYMKTCNMRCVNCHNMSYFSNKKFEKEIKNISFNQILENLGTGLFDIFIVSGGECTILGDKLVSLLQVVRNKYPDLKTRIDTNGTSPETVLKLKEYGLIDGVALDIKYPYWKGVTDDFKTITGISNDIWKYVKKTIDIIDGMPYTIYRTVEYPMLKTEDKESIKEFMSKLISPHSFNKYYNF